MKRRIGIGILLGIVVLAVLTRVLTTVLFEPWVGKKIQQTLYAVNNSYTVEISKVHISILASGVELKGITICTNLKQGEVDGLNGEIESVRVKGISLMKAIFKNNIDIQSVVISNYRVSGKIPFEREDMPPKISSANIRIGEVRFDKMDLAVKNISSAQSYEVINGNLHLYDLRIAKNDTLSSDIIDRFDFNAKEFHCVSADSMYSFTSSGIAYSAISENLTIDSADILPNYEGYAFTSRCQFQTDRVEAEFRNISVHHFSASDFVTSKSVVSSYIEIGNMETDIFRDRRKPLRHVNRPTVQDLIRNCTGLLHIDSIYLRKGNLTYTEHAEEANNPGKISFNALKLMIYGITNDTCLKAQNPSVKILFESRLMGEGKLSFTSKMEIFDSRNTFSLTGSLSSMDGRHLNPILEKNSFVCVTSGRIDKMNFGFTANNTKSTGEMTMLYHDFKVAVTNKRTDETTALKELLISIVANMKILDSNPLPGKEVRVGTIDAVRDPERFLFYYCLESILSGIRSSLVKESKASLVKEPKDRKVKKKRTRQRSE